MAVIKILYQLIRLVVAFFNRPASASGWAHLPANVEPDRKVEVPTEVRAEATAAEPSSFASKIIDRRKVSSPKHVYGNRKWATVTGICLHQTACVLGENPPRWDAVGCHVGVTRSGKVIWLHDFDKLVVHGNRWNTQTVGIEIDGMYEGVEGDPKTFWRPKDQPNLQPQRPTEVQMAAVRDLIRFIDERVRQNGGKLKALVAHRQASENRRNDPGSAIWKGVALPMSEELGLNDGGPGFRLSNGYPIPEEWDPKRKGYRY